MLYLEDYLEMIEHLPQELRDRFTEMRELDLAVQNNVDTQERRVKTFFNECKKVPEISGDLQCHLQTIRQEYNKILEDADEKVHLANTMYDLVDKYLRRLDTELHKFKCELEADNKGITEVLEKRSLELDMPLSSSAMSSQKENRYERYNRPRAEKRRDSSTMNNYLEKRQAISISQSDSRGHNSVSHSSTSVHSPSNTSPQFNIGQIGAGQAIATAASQAIAATQQMQQGRRTASLKASYEAAITGLSMHDLAIGKDLAGAAQTAFQQSIVQENNKKKKKVSSGFQQLVTAPAGVSAPASPAVDVQTQEVTDGEWTYDPNEPRYCLCNQVSYGDMVACDNDECPSEWFHYPCVGITAPPKGKWYCPPCAALKKRSRKN